MICWLSSFWLIGASAEVLSVKDYLKQVELANPGLQALNQRSSVGKERESEGNRAFMPVLTGHLQYQNDAKYGPSRFFSYNSMETNTGSLGIEQTFAFGLSLKLSYDLLLIQYQGADLSSLGPLASGLLTKYVNAGPSLGFSVPLLQNGFGRLLRAGRDAKVASAQSEYYFSSFERRAELVQAEVLYWRVAAGRELLSIQEEALDRAEKIAAYNRRKVRMSLGDRSDVLQAEALVEMRKMELLSARNGLRTACHEFNSKRQLDMTEVTEVLSTIEPSLFERIEQPVRAKAFLDVEGQRRVADAKSAQSMIEKEQLLPVLELFGSYALNSQTKDGNIPTDISKGVEQSFSFARPTSQVGLRMRAPLDFLVQKRLREAYGRAAIAAESELERKAFEGRQRWKDLEQSLEEARAHMVVTQNLEQIQRDKLSVERDRLHQGRATTYQVLLFEQDYLASQLARVRDEMQILITVAQMKLYSEESV